MEATALLTFYRPAGDEVADVDDVTQLADVLACLDTLEEGFRLLIDEVETVPGTLQAKVGTDDAHVVCHDLVDFLDALCDEHTLLVGHRPLVIPLRNVGVKGIFIDMFERMACRRLRIDHRLDERVGG